MLLVSELKIMITASLVQQFRIGIFRKISVLYQHLPQVTTMAENSPETNGRDRALSALDGFIKTLRIASAACGVPPAQVAYASVSTLLTTIKVRSIQSYDDEFRLRIYLGQNGQ